MVNLSFGLDDAVSVQVMDPQGEKDFCPKVICQKTATWLCVHGQNRPKPSVYIL